VMDNDQDARASHPDLKRAHIVFENQTFISFLGIRDQKTIVIHFLDLPHP